MKKVKITVLGFLLTISLIACKKNETKSSVALQANKTSLIKKGEPVVFTFPQAVGSTVNWSVGRNINAALQTSLV